MKSKRRKTYICHTFYWPGNCEDTFMNARGDLADTSLHAGLITQIGDVLATFADDYASIFGANKCAKGEGVLTGGGRGTRKMRGSWKADGKVSDHRWDNQEAINIPDSRETWRIWESEDMKRGREGGAGERKEEEGSRGEGGGRCEEIRMADRQQDTTQRGPPA